MSDTKYAVKSGFYDSVNRDRLYSADDMNQPYKAVLTEGVLVDADDNGFVVAAQGTPNMTVLVRPGHALLGGKWVDSDHDQTLTVPANSSIYGRIDSIVLQVNTNTNTRAANLIYRTGTPAGTPAAPDLNNGSPGFYEVRIANIAVAAGATAISTSNITDQRGTSDCPLVELNVGAAQIVASLMQIITEHPELITAVPDGGITTAKLANGAVTSAKLADNGITTQKIVDLAVATQKLADGAVTTLKIANSSVTTAKLSGVIDDTLAVSGKAADAKATGDALAALDEAKANIDGYYDGMTVGQAEQVLSNVKETERSPYIFRASGGSLEIGDREQDTLVGMDLVWNQYVPDGQKDFENTITDTKSYLSLYIRTSSPSIVLATETVSSPSLVGGVCVGQDATGLNFLHNGSSANIPIMSNNAVQIIGGHKYMYQLDVTSVDTRTVGGLASKNNMFIDLTAMFGSTIADYIYTLESGTAGAGVAWVKRYLTKDYYPYSAPTMQNGVASSHEMVGFNQYDNANPTINVVGGTQYQITGTYTALSLDGTTITPDANGKFTPSKNGTLTITGGNSTNTCVHFAYDGESDGEYEPYVKHSYPLDATVDLHGIPMKDESGNLYADGDTYEADGTVTRRYGIVDLGTLNWSLINEEKHVFGVALSGLKNGVYGVISNVLCPKYDAVPSGYNDPYISGDKIIWVYTGANAIRIKDTAYTDATTFKSSMSGVYLVYELKTPTTESAEPFQTPQIVDNWGTEEYVTEGVIPIGHSTKYPVNLRAKEEASPNSPTSDGLYLMQRLNGVNSYVPFVKELPALPSEDGNYLLGLSVSGSGTTKTLSWEVQS